MSKTSLALNNLRGYAIIIVVAFHSAIAYVRSQPASPLPFDKPPYGWEANPIIDSHRWLGFDLFCAFQFLYMMQLMFFLSGLFVWPSLQRKGARDFLYDRFLRLGVPFIVGAYLLMPLAYYPAYRATAVDWSFSAFWLHWTALPFWPSGPMWFLWALLLFNIIVVGLSRIVPTAVESLAQLSSNVAPTRCLIALAAMSAIAYFGLATVFTPWKWIDVGPAFDPVSFQPLFLPQYMIYFFAGLIVGAKGLDRSILRHDGMLVLRWSRWLAGALLAFALWIAMSALIVNGETLPGVPFVADLAVVMFAASACFAAAAIFLRFGAAHWGLFDAIADNAYGIYLFHYVFVIWMQYILLGTPLPAVAKGVIVFSASLALSWAASATVCSVPLGARLIGGRRRTEPAILR
jgi:glucans biosynthesis protein C